MHSVFAGISAIEKRKDKTDSFDVLFNTGNNTAPSYYC